MLPFDGGVHCCVCCFNRRHAEVPRNSHDPLESTVVEHVGWDFEIHRRQRKTKLCSGVGCAFEELGEKCIEPLEDIPEARRVRARNVDLDVVATRTQHWQNHRQSVDVVVNGSVVRGIFVLTERHTDNRANTIAGKTASEVLRHRMGTNRIEPISVNDRATVRITEHPRSFIAELRTRNNCPNLNRSKADSVECCHSFTVFIKPCSYADAVAPPDATNISWLLNVGALV